MEKKFLGRPIYDSDTMTYRFPDGSGVVPAELKIEMQIAASGPFEGSWLRAWSKRWAFKERTGR